MLKKIIYIIVLIFVLIFCIYLYKSITSTNIAMENIQEQPAATTTQVKVYDKVPLVTQNDFKLLGKEIYIGTGFEPGFNFKISLAADKFGVDLVSQYGETHYVGYIDLTSQSTTTKVFKGLLLNKQNVAVGSEFTIKTKKCGLPSGEEVPYSVSIVVGAEKLSGCVQLIN